MALRRQGVDLAEEEQTEFLEDHGFLIDTDKISTVIDPNASMTMEYLDMIMSIKSNDWKVKLSSRFFLLFLQSLFTHLIS
jgi:hypothetical protein